MGMNDSQRFWSKVDVREDEDECWEWQDSKNTCGYGQFHIECQKVLAHRFALLGYDALLPKNLLPKGNMVCHKCDNPKCINPDHLERGTIADNNHDKLIRGRQSSQLTYIGFNKLWRVFFFNIFNIQQIAALGIFGNLITIFPFVSIKPNIKINQP